MSLFQTYEQAALSQHYTGLLYGRPGVGKTITACTSQYLRTAYIDVEDGSLSIFSDWRPLINPGWKIAKANSIEVFDQCLEWVVSNIHLFDLLVIDTATEVQRHAVHSLSKNRKPPTPTLQDWGTSLIRLEALARLCRALPIHTVWLCHEMVDGGVIRPAFQGQFGTLLYHKHFDFIGRIFAHETPSHDGTTIVQRYLSAMTTPQWETKDRSGGLPDFMLLPTEEQVYQKQSLAPIDLIVSLIQSRAAYVHEARLREWNEQQTQGIQTA